MDAEELEENLLNPDHRVLKQITIDNFEETSKLFEDLMGGSAIPRKKYIEEHSSEVEVSI